MATWPGFGEAGLEQAGSDFFAIYSGAQRTGHGPCGDRNRSPNATIDCARSRAPRRSVPYAKRRWRPGPLLSRPSIAYRSCCCRAISSPPARSPLRCCNNSSDRTSQDVSVNDCFKPFSRYWDRDLQLARAANPHRTAGRAARVDPPAETGAVTHSLPQDVQAEAYDYPALFAKRVHRPRTRRRRALRRGGGDVPPQGRPCHLRRRGAVRGGDRRRWSTRRGDRDSGRRDAGRQGRVAVDHAENVGPVGSTSRTAANRLRGRRTWSSPSARLVRFLDGLSKALQNRTCVSGNFNVAGSTPTSTAGFRWSPTREGSRP